MSKKDLIEEVRIAEKNLAEASITLSEALESDDISFVKAAAASYEMASKIHLFAKEMLAAYNKLNPVQKLIYRAF